MVWIVVIANKNAPRQCVLSGPVGRDRASQAGLARARESPTHPVPVSAAFHSRFVAGAEEPFREVLDSIIITARRFPSSPTRRPSPTPIDPSRRAHCWPASLPGRSSSSPRSRRCTGWGRAPFSKSVPTPSSRGWSRSILEGRDHLALAVDASRGITGNLYDLACSLATLAALGYAVDLTRWDEGDFVPGPARSELGSP